MYGPASEVSDSSGYPMTNTTVRGVRVPDELWEAAQAEAERRGEALSEAIRRALTRYVRTGQHATRT